MEANFSPKDRLEIVREYIINHIDINEICKKYNVTSDQVKQWNAELFDNGEIAFIRADQLKVKSPNTRWHIIFGRVLQELLTPLNIDVFLELPVMTTSPRVDVLLIRKIGNKWTKQQKEYLPDGVRQSKAKQILIEFKYSQSFSTSALIQTLSYDLYYKNTKKEKLETNKIQTFLVLSKTPSQKHLKRTGYKMTGKKGVYKSKHEGWRFITLISLNELSDEKYNAFIKCFASKNKEKKIAFDRLKKIGLTNFTLKLQWLFNGLIQLLLTHFKGDRKMQIDLTPEQVMEIGKFWGDAFLSSLSNEKKMELFKDIPIHEKMKLFKDIPFHEKLKLFKDVPVHERLKDVPVHERLKDVPIESIEIILNLMKKKVRVRQK